MLMSEFNSKKKQKMNLFKIKQILKMVSTFLVGSFSLISKYKKGLSQKHLLNYINILSLRKNYSEYNKNISTIVSNQEQYNDKVQHNNKI